MIKVDRELLGCDIEHEDEDADVLEYVIPLRLEVLLHKLVLTTTIPQGEHQVTEEAHSLLVHIHCKCDLVGVSCQVVSKDDGPH